MSDSQPEFETFLNEDVPQIIRMMTESRVREIEVVDGEVSLTLRRADASAAPMYPEQMPSEPVAGIEFSDEARRGVKHVSAPMVGTFFHAEQPDRAPLITVGDRVEPGGLIGVIEALQVQTDVESDIAGIVKEILVADGGSVEYGQPLIEVAVDR